MIKAVFFDLDGTLLPMNEEEFIKVYFISLYKKVAHLGYEQDKLIKTIWDGTEAMYKNDGSCTNEEAFWNLFVKYYDREHLKDKEIFDSFYTNEFKNTKAVCKDNPLAKEVIDFCNKNLEYTILSTNPIFPYAGTLTRMSFVGLSENDFDFITAYENSSYCKPNPKYFEFLLNKFNLKADEVILFGNNTIEDAYCAAQVGIKTYLIDGYIIDKKGLLNQFKLIQMEDIIPTIKKHLI